jgi:hypothetical protein
LRSRRSIKKAEEWEKAEEKANHSRQKWNVVYQPFCYLRSSRSSHMIRQNILPIACDHFACCRAFDSYIICCFVFCRALSRKNTHRNIINAKPWQSSSTCVLLMWMMLTLDALQPEATMVPTWMIWQSVLISPIETSLQKRKIRSIVVQPLLVRALMTICSCPKKKVSDSENDEEDSTSLSRRV